MRIAEINERPLAFEIGVGDRFAVLVDETEGAADRAGEQGSGRTPRRFVQRQHEKGAGSQNHEAGE